MVLSSFSKSKPTSKSLPPSSNTKSKTNPPLHNVILLSFFLLYVSLILYVYFYLLPLSLRSLSFPRQLSDIRPLCQSLLLHRDDPLTFFYITVLFISIYLFLQSFAIPGAIFLSILAGPLFGITWGILLVSLCASVGSSICYLMVKHFGSHLVRKYGRKYIETFEEKVRNERENLFFYLLFLRITPILPNVSINISSPLVGVPLRYFIMATFIGLIPANWIHINTGIQLMEMAMDDSGNDGNENSMKTLKRVAMLLGLGILALIPTLVKGKLEGKWKGNQSENVSVPKGKRNAPNRWDEWEDKKYDLVQNEEEERWVKEGEEEERRGEEDYHPESEHDNDDDDDVDSSSNGSQNNHKSKSSGRKKQKGKILISSNKSSRDRSVSRPKKETGKVKK